MAHRLIFASRRFIALTAAASVISAVVERLIFWADVAAIGTAVLALLGVGPQVTLPKASHEITKLAREMPSLPAAPPSTATHKPIETTLALEPRNETWNSGSSGVVTSVTAVNPSTSGTWIALSTTCSASTTAIASTATGSTAIAPAGTCILTTAAVPPTSSTGLSVEITGK